MNGIVQKLFYRIIYRIILAMQLFYVELGPLFELRGP